MPKVLSKVSNNILGVILMFLTSLIIVAFMFEINSDKVSLDEFENLAGPIKPYLENSSSIGLITNDENIERYFEFQFVFAPVILKREFQPLDTIIIIQNLKRKITLETKIDTIYSSQNKNFRLTLGVNKD